MHGKVKRYREQRKAHGSMTLPNSISSSLLLLEVRWLWTANVKLCVIALTAAELHMGVQTLDVVPLFLGSHSGLGLGVSKVQQGLNAGNKMVSKEPCKKPGYEGQSQTKSLEERSVEWLLFRVSPQWIGAINSLQSNSTFKFLSGQTYTAALQSKSLSILEKKKLV